jgi:hypothetical protein
VASLHPIRSQTSRDLRPCDPPNEEKAARSAPTRSKADQRKIDPPGRRIQPSAAFFIRRRKNAKANRPRLPHASFILPS